MEIWFPWLQDREAVGAEWNYLLLWTDLHSSRGNRARAHKDVLQERSFSEPTGGDFAHDLCHRYRLDKLLKRIWMLTFIFSFINKHVLSFLSALQANVWFPPSRTSCHADPPRFQRTTSCCARAATSRLRSRWKSSRVSNASHILPRWWRTRSTISG